MSVDKNVDLQEKIKIICPNCGVFLKGTTREMIGDIGVCTKCKAEFTIEEIHPDVTHCSAKLKRKARSQIRAGILIGILFVLVPFINFGINYLSFILASPFILYIISAYKRWFYVNLILYALITCTIIVGCILNASSTDQPFSFYIIFWIAVFCFVLSGPIFGMLNEKKATQA